MDHQDARQLDASVNYAYRLWSEILTDRMNTGNPDHKSPVHYDRITATLDQTAGTIRGDLLTMAVNDAQSRPIPQPWSADLDQARKDFRAALNSRRHELAPPPPLPEPDRSTCCRHDRPYSGDCADCDKDFS